MSAPKIKSPESNDKVIKYISINEIDGNNWGYNGLTQDHRRNTK